MTNATQADKRVVYDVPEAGEMLGLSRAAAYDAARRGDLPTIKVGRLIKVPKVALERMLAAAGQPK
jgi:excisionase family DNA binding protein